ncbi:MAG: response regulator [Gemmatimonadetes bacterium]|uniref:Response regulator n=1 Tax=Candidatus Kutchimonas denitrificans TaxID=3056748 RepID=A0AAE4ZBR9_9BACT|nr:response regulator [Gemmatimonadota bacterium]NIR76417.1 response regulator [Candidatus Kutchimonas denitrificans]NIS03236.1 response regulator [Gemmatimonadota bacterium]NIT69097.1 response regulator [Gemmatimonadota bacterium]NIU54489.1 response regulator [Gemmatimonadota bacterium]
MTSAGNDSTAASILIVDDEPAITTVCSIQLTEVDGHDCVKVTSAAEALEWLEERDFDVVITDIRMPKMSGIDLLKLIKRKDPEIQVIIITGNPDLGSAVEAIRSQVDDYLVKPFELSQLSHSVGRALEHRALLQENRRYRSELEKRVKDQSKQIERLFLDGLAALAGAIEARDRYTGGHLDRVTRYALSMGAEMELSQQQMWNLWLGSLFHDVGKLAIPDAILNKPGPLTEEEYEEMKRHPELGVQIVERISFLVPASRAILHHQERWDGKGYPGGLAGEEICVEGRILAVADAFDAMLTNRPYREGRSEEMAVEELERCSGTQFDPSVVAAFLKAREKGFPAQLPTTVHPAIELAYGPSSAA